MDVGSSSQNYNNTLNLTCVLTQAQLLDQSMILTVEDPEIQPKLLQKALYEQIEHLKSLMNKHFVFSQHLES